MENKILFDIVKHKIVENMIPLVTWNDFILLCNSNNISHLVTRQKELINQSVFNDLLETIISYFRYLIDTGILEGANHTERLLHFQSLSENCDLHAELEVRYPVMMKQESVKINDYVIYILQILTDYLSDHSSITSYFSKEYGEIENIHISQGDNHLGKSVAIVNCKNGTIVYKPRNSGPDDLLKSIIIKLQEINNNLLDCKTPQYLSYGHHTWQEFIDYEECKDLTQIRNFYFRVGMYIAIFYVLSTIDIHYENLIAHGEYPYFIDLETIVRGKKGLRESPTIYRSLTESVLISNILPLPINDSYLLDLNFSAIFTGSSVSKKNCRYVIKEDEKDDWVYEKVAMSVIATKNVPKIAGKEIKPELVEKDLISGFTQTMTTLIQNRCEFVSIVNSVPINGIQVRQLLRPTMVYSKFLRAGRHPDYTKSIKENDAIYAILLNNFSPTSFGYLRVLREIADLKNGYVPFFYGNFDDCNLYSENEVVCENYYLESPRKTILHKLNAVTDIDVKEQIKLIQMSFANLYGVEELIKSEGLIKPIGVLNEIDVNVIIKKYVDSLIESAYKVSDKNHYAINLPVIHKSGFIPMGINVDLYNFGGLIWFLAIISKKYNYEECSNIAQGMFDSLYDKYEVDKENREKIKQDHSIFTGDGSLLYLCANFMRLFKSEKYVNIFELLFADFSKIILDCKFTEIEDFDFLSGSSGLIYFICKLIEDRSFITNLSKDKLLELTDNYCTHLAQFKEKFDIGFAHGITGICLTLSALYTLTKSNRCYFLLIEMLEKEKDLTNSSISWSWCRGEVGVTLSHYLISEMIPDLNNIFDSNKLNEGLNNILRTDDMCICHGKYGIIDALITMLPRTKSVMFYRWFNSICDIHFFQNTDYVNDSFMTGASGIVYTLMRLLDPSLPSILSLDIYHGV